MIARRRFRAGLIVAAMVASAGAARAQSCPRLPATLVCAPTPEDSAGRQEMLEALDQEGRAAVSRGDYVIAASAFGCLVQADPTPESAGNLAVVLREQGALGDALLIARCAEELAAPGPARERARARRVDIEQRIGFGPGDGAAGVTAPPQVANTRGTTLTREAPARDRSVGGAPAAAGHRHWAYTALAVGAAALVGGGVLYALARHKASQFDDEQSSSGYSDRARALHDDAQGLQRASWITSGLAAAALATGGVLFRF